MTDDDLHDSGGRDSSPLDLVWRTEEMLLHALIEDIRTLRVCATGAGGDAGVEGDEGVGAMADAPPSEPGSPMADPAAAAPEAADGAAGSGWPADAATGLWADGADDPDGGQPEDAHPAAGSGGDVVATLTAIDGETGDCFCYDIVDANGAPFDHPYYELVGHQIRRRAGLAEVGPEFDSLCLRVTNAAGDVRILEYALASGELTDRGRVVAGAPGEAEGG